MGAIYEFIVFASPGSIVVPPPPPPTPPPIPGSIPPERNAVLLNKTRWTVNVKSGVSPFYEYTLNLASRPELEEE